MRVNRFLLAMVAYAVLAVLSWNTITDEKLRLATLAVLVLFAVKTVVRRKDVLHPDAKANSGT
jgi:heme exporter protein D